MQANDVKFATKQKANVYIVNDLLTHCYKTNKLKKKMMSQVRTSVGLRGSSLGDSQEFTNLSVSFDAIATETILNKNITEL